MQINAYINGREIAEVEVFSGVVKSHVCVVWRVVPKVAKALLPFETLDNTQHYFQADLKAVKEGKAVPLQAWTGPEGSRKLRFPDFVTTAQDGGGFSALRTGGL